MFGKFNSFIGPMVPYLTFACFLIYCYLWYVGATVEAWHVVPWIVISLINDIEDLLKRKLENMTNHYHNT